MRNEEAKLILEQYIPKDSRGNGKSMQTLKLTEAFLLAIRALDEQTKWIPVLERLPDKEGEYIVTDDAGGMATVSTDEIVYDDKGKLIWLCSQNVTAWMSLPKAYTESEVEE